MNEPTVGTCYAKNGYTFRVDFIENGEVECVRWKGKKKWGVGLRVPLAVWLEEMKGAIEIPVPA